MFGETRLTWRIATAETWVMFTAVVIATVSMVTLRGVGFLIAAFLVFGWLYSGCIELAKASGVRAQWVPRATALALLSVCLWVFPYPFILFKVPGIFALLVPGFVMLGAMLFLQWRQGGLLAKLETNSGTPTFLAGLFFGGFAMHARIRRALLRGGAGETAT